MSTGSLRVPASKSRTSLYAGNDTYRQLAEGSAQIHILVGGSPCTSRECLQSSLIPGLEIQLVPTWYVTYDTMVLHRLPTGCSHKIDIRCSETYGCNAKTRGVGDG